MRSIDNLPFRSLRDLVLKELQREESVLTWNGDTIYTEHVLSGVLNSEAYLLDESAHDYLLELASGLSMGDYYRALANTRMPFESVWIEFTGLCEKDAITGDPYEPCSDGALIINSTEGIKILTARVLHDVKPWTVLYSGTEVTFGRDGQVLCSKTPIAKLYDRLALAAGYTTEDMLNRDIDTALRIGGIFAVLCAALERPRIFDREPPRPLRKSEVKGHMQASRQIPRYNPSLIRLSKIGWAERGSATRLIEGDENTSRAAHWVRGHIFLARNGKLTWRRSHIRGSGPAAGRVHRVTE